MTPKKKLEALRAEAAELQAKSQTDEWTDADNDRAIEIGKEAQELQEQIDRAEKASKALGQLARTNPRSENPDAPTASKARTLGQRFTQSEAYQSFKADNPEAVTKDTPINIRAKDLGRFASKDALNTITTGNAEAVPVDQVDDLVYRPTSRLLEVITHGSTSLPWFKYRQVIAKTNNAKIVPEHGTAVDAEDNVDLEASLKPLSSILTKTAEAKEHTYADGMEATNQELADDGIIESLIDSTLRENLELEVARVLLNGDPDEGEPAGILNTTGVLQQAFDTDVPTTIRKSITQLRTTSGAHIRGVLLNPEDNETWDLLKDAEGRYLGAGPFGTGPGTAWGYERIEDQAIPVGQALIGDFSTIHLLTYKALQILAFNQHKDYAQRNLTYIRGELRAVQLIRNASKLCLVDLTA